MIRSMAVLLFGICLSFNVLARQSGGGSGDDLGSVCDLSGGTYTESASGWACCWSDWGCYGCTSGECKIKCHTQRCKDANGQARPGVGLKAIDGLASPGMKAPIVPENPKRQLKMKDNSDLKKIK